MLPITIEVCVESLESAQIAIKTGCHRVELCSRLAVGGVTPSVDLVRQILQLVTRQVVVLIRARPGDFHYDSEEQAAMIRSAKSFAHLGVSGVAVGAVQGHNWNLPFMRQMAGCVVNCDLVAHRAIDELLGPSPATIARIAEIVQPLIDLGFRRILTSGGYPDALLGSDNIRKLIEFAAGRIEILPGGGVTPENALSILNASGARQIHGSFQQLPRDSDEIMVDVSRLKKVVYECFMRQ
jgi:copper homeostasis protein